MPDLRGSLFVRAFLSLIAGVLILSAAFYAFSVPYIRQVTVEIEENAARLHLDQVYLLVSRAHDDLARWRHGAMASHRRQIENVLLLTESYIREVQADVGRGNLTEDEARRLVLSTVRSLQYGNNDYVWIVDFNGIMQAHPGKEIEGTSAYDHPTLGDIVRPIITQARDQGDGYLRYYWPRRGEDRPVEKLAYFRTIREWGWVVSTGVYIDDVEKEVAERQGQLIEELRERLAEMRFAGSGYLYIFDHSGRMIIHPNRQFDRQRFVTMPEPSSGRPLFEMLVGAADSPSGAVRYLWDSPEDPGNFVHSKVSWVRQFAPFDWYIAASVYTEELQASSQALTRRIGLVIIGGLLMAALGGYGFAWVFTRPIQRLTMAARRVADGDWSVSVDLTRRDEIGTLAAAFASMVAQIQEHIRTLETRVAERTAQLTQANAEMAAANDRLRELDTMKSDFLSSVSHELRTPLTSIRGFAKLISRDFDRWFRPTARDPALAAKASQLMENVGIIGVESERLTRLINDVLDLAKIESGRIEWHDDEVAPAELVTQALNAVRGQFEQRPAVRLEVDIAPDLPPLRLDRDRLVQVLVNILNNAAKFTEQGSVKVAARKAPDGGVHISIADSGCGFPPDQAEAVFDKFRQVSHSDTLVDKPHGTGLGLAICREIVGHYGGAIWAESAVGRGSTFHIVLPQATSVAEQRPEPAPTRPDVLIVEDDAHVRSYLMQFFTAEGFTVTGAADGEAGVAAALALRPSVVVMDLDLPRLDGMAAIRILRRKLAAIPIVVISGLPHPERAGADVTIAKPVDEARLLAAVRLLLTKQPPNCDGRCVVVTAGDGVPTFPFAMPVSAPTEICTVAELPARLAEGIDGCLILPVELVDGIDLAAMARQVPQLIIASARDADEETES